MKEEYIIITTPSCGDCRQKMRMAEANGIKLREVSVMTEEGNQLAGELKLTNAGTILHMPEKRIVNLEKIFA